MSVILVGLASFGLTYMVRYSSGPFNIFYWILSLAGIARYPVLDGDGNIVNYIEEIETPNRFITKLVSCFWCLTTWISGLLTILYIFAYPNTYWSLWLLIWFGSIGLSGWLYERIPDGKSE